MELDKAVKNLFEFYDTNHSGYLDLDEMLRLMGDIGIKDKKIVMRTMAQLDHDESGFIDRAEFTGKSFGMEGKSWYTEKFSVNKKFLACNSSQHQVWRTTGGSFGWRWCFLWLFWCSST